MQFVSVSFLRSMEINIFFKQEAAHHLITTWLKRQNSQEKAFSDLMSAVKDSDMNQIVVGITQMKEATTWEKGLGGKIQTHSHKLCTENILKTHV